MPTNHTPEGYVLLNVSGFTGNPGDAGSTFSWTSISTDPFSDNPFDITDVDDDGLLDAGNDYYFSAGFTYTGYTITVSGVAYPVFDTSGQYVVMLDQNGTTQNLIGASGTSDPYSAETAAYLCFAAGSLIATPEGEREVEHLQIGDRVTTQEGRAVSVKWIGRQTVSTRFGPAERLMPVRFEAGSLGEGLPHADLTVTADHGMLVDGVICHAGALVNGETVTRVPLAEMGERYTVYHIETENHEIIFANGAPAETFIDNAGRRAFDNFAEFEALYGDLPEMEELSYPRAMSARQVPARIKALLAGKAAA
jgi:hypothetical protein